MKNRNIRGGRCASTPKGAKQADAPLPSGSQHQALRKNARMEKC